jgi:hypothetical protein
MILTTHFKNSCAAVLQSYLLSKYQDISTRKLDCNRHIVLLLDFMVRSCSMFGVMVSWNLSRALSLCGTSIVHKVSGFVINLIVHFIRHVYRLGIEC